MKHNILICFIVIIHSGVILTSDDSDIAGTVLDVPWINEDNEVTLLKELVHDNDDVSKSECWLRLGAQSLINDLEKIDDKYDAVRKTIQNYFEQEHFDQRMLHKMLAYRGAAFREITKEKNTGTQIPAGLNLGGLCMVRLTDSVLFFHRMKLRNNTVFRINALHNDIENMMLRAHIALNDVHLQGAFERSITDRDPSKLFYAPSFGELQLLLKDAQFRIQGRYKMIKDRLTIEVMTSELEAGDVLMTYVDKRDAGPAININLSNLGNFIHRLKTDLTKWVKDYFNDYLIYENLENVPNLPELQKYDKEKAALLASFMDNTLMLIKERIRTIGAATIRVPNFSIKVSQGLKFLMNDGTLSGLDTMYRRSVVTTVSKGHGFRNVDSIIGFSNLKVTYKYEVIFAPDQSPINQPVLNGLIILSASEMLAHMSLGLLREPEVMDLDIDFLSLLGPDSLTLEGPANVLISNFKHVLKHQVATIMSNTLIYGIGMLRSLPRCEPFVPGQLIGTKKKHRNAQLKNSISSSSDGNSSSSSFSSLSSSTSSSLESE